MRPLDFLGRIKVKLGIVIVLAVGTAFVVNEVGLKSGLSRVVRIAVAVVLALIMVQLLADVWDWVDASGTRTVDSHIKALRRKLGPDLIRTVHGVGYSVEPHAAPLD
jgi:hypothetical protein